MGLYMAKVSFDNEIGQLFLALRRLGDATVRICIHDILFAFLASCFDHSSSHFVFL